MKRALVGGLIVIVILVAVMLRARDTTPAEAGTDAEAQGETQGWDVHRGGNEVVEEDTFTRQSQADLPYISEVRQIPNSSQTYELQIFQSGDHVLIPVGIRKPEGQGPFPAVIMSSGNGYDSFSRIDRAMYTFEPMIDMMVERGYVVAFGNYRNEIPNAYNEYERCEYIRDDISGGARALLNAPCLDHNDYIHLIEHVKALAYTDSDGVGTIGVSHSGELQMKAASETSWGAAVPIEGASYEFLAIDSRSAPRRNLGGEARLLWLPDVESTLPYVDMEKARARIARIDDDMPILHIGRDEDHLQGVFRLTYEISAEAGKNAQWLTFADELHGFGLLPREEDGTFEPSELRLEAFDAWMSFFDEHLKGADRSGGSAATD
jgi:dienelactone hydrolase